MRRIADNLTRFEQSRLTSRKGRAKKLSIHPAADPAVRTKLPFGLHKDHTLTKPELDELRGIHDA